MKIIIKDLTFGNPNIISLSQVNSFCCEPYFLIIGSLMTVYIILHKINWINQSTRGRALCRPEQRVTHQLPSDFSQLLFQIDRWWLTFWSSFNSNNTRSTSIPSHASVYVTNLQIDYIESICFLSVCTHNFQALALHARQDNFLWRSSCL